MAAIKLEELMAGQKRLEEKSQDGERMSLSQLKELLGAQKNSADKQLKASNEIISLSKNSKDIQKEQLDLMAKTDQRRAKTDEVIVKTARETHKEIQKQRKAAEAFQKAASAESAKRVTDKAMGMERFKTIGDRVEGFKSSVKSLFTLRGFLDKSGLVQKGTGGILDTALAKREARNQYSEDRMKMEVAAGRMVDTAENRKTFKRQFDRQQVNLGEIQKNEAEIKRLQDLGYSDEQINLKVLFEKREKLAKQAAKDDTRLREKKEKPEGLSLLSSPVTKDISLGESSEDILEQNKEIQKQTELLEKIEENTRQSKDSTAKKEEKKEEKKEGGFELPSLGDLLKVGKGGLKGLGRIAKGGLKGLGSLAKGGMQLARGLPLGSMALGAAPLAAMYGVTKWAEGASIQGKDGELTGTGKVLDTASKAIGGSGVKPEAEMTAAEKMEKDTKVSWWEFGGKDKKIKVIKDNIERGVEYSPEEAAVIKKNLGFDIPEENIKKPATTQPKEAQPEPVKPEAAPTAQPEPAKPEAAPTAQPEPAKPEAEPVKPTITPRDKSSLFSEGGLTKAAEPAEPAKLVAAKPEAAPTAQPEPAKPEAESVKPTITPRDKSSLFPEGGLTKAAEPAEPAKLVAVKPEKAAPGEPQKRDKSGLFSSEEPKAPTAVKLTGKQERELFSKNQDLYDKFKNYEEDIIDAEMAKFKKDPSYATMSEDERQKKFEAIKQGAATQASAKFSKELQDTGIVKPSAAPETTTQPTQANEVYQQSAEVQAAEKAPAAAPVIINAPQSTNVNQTSQFATRSPSRNTDSSYQQYNMSKFAF